MSHLSNVGGYWQRLGKGLVAVSPGSSWDFTISEASKILAILYSSIVFFDLVKVPYFVSLKTLVYPLLCGLSHYTKKVYAIRN